MRASIVLLVNISAVLWLFVQPAYPQAMASNDTVMLKLNQVIRANGGLEVSYEIKNITESDVWLFVGSNRPRLKAYETRVKSDENMVSISIRGMGVSEGEAYVPIAPTLPALVSRYKRLRPGLSMMFRLTLDSTVKDYEPLGGVGLDSISALDIKELELVAGYYALDLQSEEACCSPAESANEIFIQPHWARANMDSAISITVSKSKRWK